MGRKTDFLKLPDNLLEEVKGEYTYTRTHAHTHTHTTHCETKTIQGHLGDRGALASGALGEQGGCKRLMGVGIMKSVTAFFQCPPAGRAADGHLIRVVRQRK